MPLPVASLHQHEGDVAVDDFTLRVRLMHVPDPAAAERPWLVFLHDALGSIELWRELPAQLAAATGCHALVYDRRGHGRSSPLAPTTRPDAFHAAEVPVLWQVLDYYRIGRVILVGHSDGATIALLAAAHAPARVVGVVSESAHVFVEAETLAGVRAARHQYQTTDFPVRLARHHGAKADALFRVWTETRLRPSFRSWNIEARLPRIQCPVLVLQGEADEYGTWAQAEAIARQVGGPVRCVPVPGAGHTPHKEAPAYTLRQMTDFLQFLTARQ